MAVAETEELSRHRNEKPADALVEELEVARTERVSPGFVRVTLRPVDPRFAERYRVVGADQWFRLFLPDASGRLELPWGGAEGWYARLLAMPEDSRPRVRNYTIRAVRHEGAELELDVDFVVHGTGDEHGADEHGDQHAGDSATGVAAVWALGAVAGDRVGFLDQGAIFQPPTDARRVVIVADETGVPGVEGILRGLAPETRATVLLEVPDAVDVRELPSRATAETRWLVRAHPAGSGRSAVLDAIDGDELGAPFDGADYVYAVGEATLALGVRSRAEAAGVPRPRVDFCAYWRPSRRR